MIAALPMRRALATALVAVLALTACGTDTSRTESSRIAMGVATGLKNRVMARGGTPGAPPNPEAIAASAKSSFEGPLILAAIEKTGGLTALGEYGRNGRLQTFATSNRQSLIFIDGVLVGTRGLGDDLMSSGADTAIARITRRQAGPYQRVYRFLDGEDIERPLPMDCTIALGPAKSFTFSGTHYDTVQVDETCRRDAFTVTNNYWVTGGGTIALSRQWISRGLGYVTIQLVRS